MGNIPLGIQLFTVREELKNDFKATFRALADMGYQGVEMAGNYGGLEPVPLAEFLKSLGLRCAGVHSSTAELSDAASKTYQYAEALGAAYVSTGRLHDVNEKWDGVIKEMAVVGEVAHAKGVTFTYHNHDPEFIQFDGKYALDILFERTDPALVQAELDTYWIKKGGADPIAYIRKYKGRVPQIHVKDMDGSDESFTELGAGIIDIKAVFALADEIGAKWIIYEQDRWKTTGIDSAKKSIEYLKGAGLI